MRLHNRQLKGSFFQDTDLLQWPRDKRLFYQGLIALADDSGCLENSAFAFKLHIFPSPLDDDLTVEVLSAWRDELLAQKKVIAYEAKGKQCLYVANFHKHQKLKNPVQPEVPLPPWLSWLVAAKNPSAGHYEIREDVLEQILNPAQAQISSELAPLKSSISNDLGVSGLITATDPDDSDKVLRNTLEVLSDDLECLRNCYQPKPKPIRNTDDDDNARARAREQEERVACDGIDLSELPRESSQAGQIECDIVVLSAKRPGTACREDGTVLAADKDDSPYVPLPTSLDTQTRPQETVIATGPEKTETAHSAVTGTLDAIRYAETNFGRMLSPAEIQDLSHWSEEFRTKGSESPDGIVVEGLKRCVEQDQRKLSYLRGILTDWLAHGVIGPADIAARDEEWSAQKGRLRTSGRESPGQIKATKNTPKGENANAKGIKHTRYDDSSAYDPAAWARAGFAVSG